MEQIKRHLSTALSAMTVSSFLKALNDNDYEAAAEFMDENVRFEGVLGSVDGRKNYLDQMAKMKFHYDVKKLLYDERYVSVLYEIDMDGENVITSGWYEVRDGRIVHICVIFDPRPVLS